MACREPGSNLSMLRSTFRGLLALALVAAPVAAASAATLSQVRVGTHENHTRIVLELDEAASYRLAPPAAGGSQLQIQLEADSAARHIASKSPLVKAVRVEPSQRGSTISVDLTKGNVEISEMVLANPPRIVLDVKPAGSMAAMTAPPAAAPKPEPAPRPTAEPAQVVAPAPKPDAAPAPTAPPAGRLAADGKPVSAAEPAASKGAAPSLSDPVPSDIVAKPAARFEAPAPAPELEPAAQPVARVAPPAKPAAAPPTKPTSANPEIFARAEAQPEGASAEGAAKEAEGAAKEASAAAPAAAEEERAAPPAARPAEVVVRKPTPLAATKPVAAAATWTDRLTSPVGYAAIGAVLLLFVVLAVRRRRRDEDDDPLYSVMAADDAGADEDDLRGQQQDDSVVEWGRRDEEPGVESAYEAPGFDADEPISRNGSQQLALGRLRADEAEAPAPAAEPDPDAMFDGPGVPAIAEAPAPVVAAPSDAYAGGDATRIVGEFEGRIKDLERRIEQLAEARERLERQVAAQTEELRVQRAAIARTQRVVRSMSKGEDLATEPVPRSS
jgi:hypothetical protein